jgi:hypothetical protein
VPERGSPVDPVARGLFAKNCATCHGLDGSGQGPSVLDRPARNFKDGGFSFGNTADAIFNTISSGIPGTPMPAFADALAESDRRRLAAYVRTLGPPIDEIDVADTILTVTEESGPRIVRGILPPIVKGAPVRPRGLLVGLPGGLTFEYRIDDVRLLGVRQGGFVERTDWRDRGGTPLKPLGGLIWVDGDGDPPATFYRDFYTAENGPPSAARPDATLTLAMPIRLGNTATSGSLQGTARCEATGEQIHLAETLYPVRTKAGDGFKRLLVFSWNHPVLTPPASGAGPIPDAASERWIRIRVPTPVRAKIIDRFGDGEPHGVQYHGAVRGTGWRSSGSTV